MPAHAPRVRAGRRLASLAVSLLALTAVLAAEPAAGAATTTVAAGADAYVYNQGKYKNANFGTSSELRLSGNPQQQQRAYLKFTVPSYSGQLTSASLRLWSSTSSAAGWQVRAVSSSTWGETTITSNNAPAMSGTVSGASGAVAPGWAAADVTSLVKAPGIVTVGLTTTDSNLLSLASRETGTNAPQLVLTTSAITTDTTAPSAPTGLRTTAVAQTEVDLAWTASADDVGVAGYSVYRDGTAIATVGGAPTSYADQAALAGTPYVYTVDAFDAAGNRSARSSSLSVTTPAATPTPPPPADPVIAAAGDIACDPADPNFNGGAGTTDYCRMAATANLLGAKPYAAALTIGDNQYEDGAPLSKWLGSYDLSWGHYLSITRPVVGNHEYQTGTASGYFDYFGSLASGVQGRGYYSYDVGAWHIVALNSECGYVGGCGAGSVEETWLRNDLAAHPAACTLAYWHEPRFTSGWSGAHPDYDAWWKDLFNSGADVVLNGHDHVYERFGPQDPAGAADAAQGIREFVVGTGGKNHSSFPYVAPNSQVRNANTFGLLELTLHAGSYDWRFAPIAGSSFTDSGSTACHGAPAAPFKAPATSTYRVMVTGWAERAMARNPELEDMPQP
jgi:acid phosphatase type 7